MQRVALITGSIRGLGLATARRFARRGDLVHVTYHRSAGRAVQLEPEFESRIHRVDLRDQAATVDLVQNLLESSGQLDHVVHCVGDYYSAPLAKTSVAEVQNMWSSNVETALHLFDAVRPALRRTRGTAVFLGCAGLEGLRARKQVAAYAAAKSALCVLARSWALEEAEFGVRVNLVSPGIIPHEHAAEETHDAALQAAIPLGAPGTPEDIAEACAWLCSDAARHVTGVNLPVTGGWQG